MSIVYLSLGSNLGDRVSFIQQATRLLVESGNVKIIRTSALYETEPWGLFYSNWFINAVVEIKTSLSAQALLILVKQIQTSLGRIDKDKNDNNTDDRTIDIDILFYDNDIINEDDLIIPHKRMHKRAFVLVPFMELNSEFIHPILNKTISQLHFELEEPEDVFLFGAIERD